MAERLELENALARFDRLLLDTCVLIAEFNRPTGRLRAINRPQRATSKVSLSLAQTFPIVTSNVKDFEDVAGLRYVAW
jgi:hypothetical protein